MEEEFYNLRKRHATGLISLDIYEEFSIEMTLRKAAPLKQIETIDQKISNPKELINFTCMLASNLSTTWESGDYYQKQIFQTTLFPDGLVYDSKIDLYRTPKVNSVIDYIADIAKDLGEIKKPDFLDLSEKSGLVPPVNLS